MMDDGKLSQHEIDALLNATSDLDDSDESESNEIVESDYLTVIEKDTLGEIGNISFSSAATSLSALLNQKVEITTPSISVIKKDDLLSEFDFDLVSVEVKYVEGFSGQNVFVIKATDAAVISDIMLGGDGTNPDMNMTEIHLSAVQEAMNQMMGAAATSMSTIFNKKVDISPPNIEQGDAAKKASTEYINEEIFVQVSFQLKVGELIDSSIMQLIPFPFANELVAELLNPKDDTEESTDDAVIEEIEQTIEEEIQTKPTEPVSPQVKNDATSSSQKNTNHQSVAHTKQEEPQHLGQAVAANSTVQEANFSEFDEVTLNKTEHRNLDMLLDIPLKVTVELGRTEKSIKDILDLSAGSIIELDKLAGEPIDVFVNEKLIAKGEVVVIEENFGVRVTDIVSQTDRLLHLK